MGPGGRSAARVQRVQRVRPAFGRLVQRVADCRSAAMLIKSALRDLAFCVIWHDKHYVDQPPPVAFPPLVPYGTKGGNCISSPARAVGLFSDARRAVVKVFS